MRVDSLGDSHTIATRLVFPSALAYLALGAFERTVTRFGIILPSGGRSGPALEAQSLADAARRIEAAGFESVWAFDAIGRGFLLADPLTALSVAATVTRHVELGTGVLQVPLRNPVELAQRVLTTHLVSGGRLRLGVGAGSTAADFEALGLDFASRFRRLDESLSIMRRLWTGERVGRASLEPVWPAALGGPPVLIGSWAGSRWIERAARDFDGWVGSGARSSWRLLREGIARFRDLSGRRAVVTNVVAHLDGNPRSPDGPDDGCDLRCSRDQARERLHRLRALGFDDIVLVTRNHDAAHLQELHELTVSSR
ncbi:MAG: 5,10-methylene tetrahydromethanopterin reductase [Candidatus Rokuibacteriota bacterium]|nr:MAG: 5,10-methylene tetrahydromethanopterin reductase [Candidatus Rokubacteria bacterium]